MSKSNTNRQVSRRSLLKAAALSSVGALAAACAPRTAPTEEAGISAQQPASQTEITYWQAPIWRYGKDNKTPNAPIDEWFNESIRRFEEANPDIKVKAELIPWDNWNAKVQPAIASGSVPNLLYGPPRPEWVQTGVFDPVDDFVTDEIKELWAPYMLEACTVFGKIYGIPTFANPNMYALSKTALEQYGGADLIPSDPLRRFSYQTAEKMAETFSDGKERFFMGVPVGDHPASIYMDVCQAFLGRGVAIWDEAGERFIAHENDRSIEALQWFVDMQTKGWMIPNLPKWSDVDTFYWTLKCAGRGQWPGIQTELETAQVAGQAGSPFEIVLVSHMYDEEMEPHLAGANGGGSFTVGKTTNSAQRSAAFRLGNYYALDAWVGEAWLVNGFFPTSKPQVDAVANNPLLQDPNKRWCLNVYMKEYKPEPVTSYVLPPHNTRTARLLGEINIFDLWRNQLQSVLLGQKSPAEMIKEIGTLINTTIGAKP